MIRATVPLLIRATVPLLALLALAGPATAQQTAERTHVVTTGETLGSIAAQYYGAASEWPRIFEANRDQLSDPDIISTGVTLVIPEGPAGAAQVTGVDVLGPPPVQQELLSYEARRELLANRPFQPLAVPELPAAERTVFFNVPDPGERANVTVVQSPELIPAFPPSFFYAASWLVPLGDRSDQTGTVISMVGPGPESADPSAQLYATVRIRSSGAPVPLVGEEILSYRMARALEGVGEIAIPTGRLVVTEAGEDEVVAQVIQAFGWLRVGDLVAEGRVFPLEAGVHPTEPGGGLEGRVIDFEDEMDLHIPGDAGYVDLGLADGLALGDVLVGVADTDVDWTGRALGIFQVVGLDQETATVRILDTVAPTDMRPGLRVVVDRKMP
jgi:hypothetical protein